MTTHKVRMVGHGVDLELPGFGGLPTYCTAPRALRDGLEAAYRQVVGEAAGGLAQASCPSRTRQISEHVYETSQAVEFSLYKAGPDGTARRVDSTRRVFRLYSRSDYRQA